MLWVKCQLAPVVVPPQFTMCERLKVQDHEWDKMIRTILPSLEIMYKVQKQN